MAGVLDFRSGGSFWWQRGQTLRTAAWPKKQQMIRMEHGNRAKNWFESESHSASACTTSKLLQLDEYAKKLSEQILYLIMLLRNGAVCSASQPAGCLSRLDFSYRRTQGFLGFKYISQVKVWRSMAEPLQDVIWGFVEQQVRDKTSFEWISQLRYYWEVDDRQQENMWACTPDLADHGATEQTFRGIRTQLNLCTSRTSTVSLCVPLYDCSLTFGRQVELIEPTDCFAGEMRSDVVSLWFEPECMIIGWVETAVALLLRHLKKFLQRSQGQRHVVSMGLWGYEYLGNSMRFVITPLIDMWVAASAGRFEYMGIDLKL